MNNGRNGGTGRAKVPTPYRLEEQNVTIQSLRRWFNTVNNYNKQNDEYLQFYEGEERAQWTALSKDPTRGLHVAARDEVPADGDVPAVPAIGADEAITRSRRLRRDLDTLLNNYASYVPEAFYDLVLEEATSIKWIYNKLVSSLGLESTRQFILSSQSIKYDPENGDTPEKLYLRLRAHYAQAAPKNGTMFGGEKLTQDATINPLVELMLVEKCLEKIDPRLPNHVMQTRGYLMQNEGKTLFCVRQLLWNQIEAMLLEIETDNHQISPIDVRSATMLQKRGSYQNRFQKRGGRTSSRGGQRGAFGGLSKQNSEEKICGTCFRAGKPQSVFLSHNSDSCYSARSEMVKTFARLVLDQENMEEEEGYEDYTGQEQDHQEEETQ